jgi:hypothetical protein
MWLSKKVEGKCPYCKSSELVLNSDYPRSFYFVTCHGCGLRGPRHGTMEEASDALKSMIGNVRDELIKQFYCAIEKCADEQNKEAGGHEYRECASPSHIYSLARRLFVRLYEIKKEWA